MAEPYIYTVLREVLGRARANDVIREIGGGAVYVPQAATEAHPLARRIGLDALAVLVQMYPGETVTVPLAASTLRRQAVAEAMAEGLSAPEIRRRVGGTVRDVYRLVAAIRATDDVGR